MESNERKKKKQIETKKAKLSNQLKLYIVVVVELLNVQSNNLLSVDSKFI
jgi:hypothetical protein